MENAIGFIFRYFHVLAGITWIGMLYYFNFVQTEYFKEAEADAKKDAMASLLRVRYGGSVGALRLRLRQVYICSTSSAHSLILTLRLSG